SKPPVRRRCRLERKIYSSTASTTTPFPAETQNTTQRAKHNFFLPESIIPPPFSPCVSPSTSLRLPVIRPLERPLFCPISPTLPPPSPPPPLPPTTTTNNYNKASPDFPGPHSPSSAPRARTVTVAVIFIPL
ncbi:hypothetical protein EMPG_11930, partial [Blastomyces silverae]